MKRVNVHDFYALAIAVHPLTDVAEGARIGDLFVPLANTKDLTKSLLEHPTYRMQVVLAACRKLNAAVSVVIPDDYSKVDFKRNLDWGEAYGIRESAKVFETVLIAELPTLNTYIVDQKGAYATEDLVERADTMLPKIVRDQLPAFAVEDWRHAGRAFVFDLPTAAGFHIMRATESVIRLYYGEVVGAATKVKQRNWGAYAKKLGEHGADPKIVSAIDQMRDLHRNPLLHPEEMLTEAEAQSLFAMAHSVMAAMVYDLEKRRKAKAIVAAPSP